MNNREMKKELLEAICQGLLDAKPTGIEFGGKTVDYAEVQEDPNTKRGRIALFVGMTDGTTVGITVNDAGEPSDVH